MKHVDVVIVGGGPAGISAAIWCQRLGIDYLLIEKEDRLGGQLPNIHNEIIDYPGLYAKNGKEMRKMFEFHFNDMGCLSKLNSEVVSVDAKDRTITIGRLGDIHYRYLILATGAGQRYLGVPGERDMILRGETYSATADSHLFKDKPVAVVGGGDRAVEGAVLLSEAGAKVYLIHRSQNFKARSQYLDIAVSKNNIHIICDTEVQRINGEDHVSSIDLKSRNGEVSQIKVNAVLIRIGNKPNNEVVKNTIDFTEEGLIITDPLGRTSNPYIYAIGDICTKPLFSSISLAAGQGALVAKHLSFMLKKH
jgi:thioredoxin reductase (NADPH)